ncbi:hypothetical protein AB0N05_36640 [Nocardia sp. NPDC051030]|uniref:hypothetical protein n=1 Tax=Nocardia sp. NPDC051030 TaxID=3155162 RepID=UPI00343A7D29
MIAECPSCAWPSPTSVSSNRPQYLRCVCGKWLISVHGKVVGTAGGSTFSHTNPLAGLSGARD